MRWCDKVVASTRVRKLFGSESYQKRSMRAVIGLESCGAAGKGTHFGSTTSAHQSCTTSRWTAICFISFSFAVACSPEAIAATFGSATSCMTRQICSRSVWKSSSIAGSSVSAKSSGARFFLPFFGLSG